MKPKYLDMIERSAEWAAYAPSKPFTAMPTSYRHPEFTAVMHGMQQESMSMFPETAFFDGIDAEKLLRG